MLVLCEKRCIFAAAFNDEWKVSSGVMAALQILVLPVKVRILARQLTTGSGETCYGM